MNFLKRLFGVFKCAFCSKKECRVRYQLGNRSYYSHLGFVRMTCPKKRENFGYVPTVSEICNHLKSRVEEEETK